MSDTKYLFKRDQTWWVKITVPRTLRDVLGYDLRRSLHTSDLEAARAARAEVVAEFRGRIAEARARKDEALARACGAPLPSESGSASSAGFEITAREDFSDVTYLLEVHHPMLARAAAPGQFVVVVSHERGERIPLTIADFDRSAGTITLVVQAVGKTTREMQERCQVGTRLSALVGPMGIPSEIGKAQKVVCVGGGLGVAPIYPQLRAFKQSGAYVIGVVGFRNRELVFWQEKFEEYCDEFIICTDDGSAGIKGLVTDGIEQALARHADVDRLVAIGPPIMMKACAETTRPHGIETTVSLNPIMVDGTGMCGGCRVKVGDQTRFACVEGPEFDGHAVDFDDLMSRLRRFSSQEKQALEAWSEATAGARQG
ncbi:MAG: ferredoxin-NADP reductase [Deltaproteobacteria bacterium]|nr:ferredoxin-NADP reductase [Deltaproteobacteria bacterium]